MSYMTSEEREQDLINKVSLLRSALISEKEKTKSLEEDLKLQRKQFFELETELDKKEKEFIKITSEKHKLISQIDFHRHIKLKAGESLAFVDNNSYDFDAEEMSTRMLKTSVGSACEILSPITQDKSEDCITQDTTKQSLDLEEKSSSKGFFSFINNIKDLVNKKESNQTPKREEQTVNDHAIASYELLISNLTLEVQNFKILLTEANNNTKKVKEEFQNILLKQMQRNKEIESELKKCQNELIYNSQSSISLVNQNKTYEIKLNTSENYIKKLEADLNACQDTIKKFQSIIGDKDSLVFNLQENVKKAENDSAMLAKKLADLKSAILEENVRDKTFTGEKKDLFSYSFVSLTFTKTQDGFYVAVIKDDVDSEYILIEDIDSISTSNENDNSVEIKYIKDKKKKTITLYMNENIHEIVRVFRSYRDRALKQLSN